MKEGTCFDLSAATDRFPITVQKWLLEAIGYEGLAGKWSALATERDFHFLAAENADERKVRYATGQGMGTFGSFVIFSLAHHAAMQYAAWVASGRSSHEWFMGYRILGDDNGIGPKPVADIYRALMGKLDVPISDRKTIETGLPSSGDIPVTPTQEVSTVGVSTVEEDLPSTEGEMALTEHVAPKRSRKDRREYHKMVRGVPLAQRPPLELMSPSVPKRTRQRLSVEFAKEVWVNGVHILKVTFRELKDAFTGLNSYTNFIRKLVNSDNEFMGRPNLRSAMTPWMPTKLACSLTTARPRIALLPNITQRATVLLTSPIGPFPLSILSWLTVRHQTAPVIYGEFSQTRADPVHDKASDATLFAYLLAVARFIQSHLAREAVRRSMTVFSPSYAVDLITDGLLAERERRKLSGQKFARDLNEDLDDLPPPPKFLKENFYSMVKALQCHPYTILYNRVNLLNSLCSQISDAFLQRDPENDEPFTVPVTVPLYFRWRWCEENITPVVTQAVIQCDISSRSGSTEPLARVHLKPFNLGMFDEDKENPDSEVYPVTRRFEAIALVADALGLDAQYLDNSLSFDILRDWSMIHTSTYNHRTGPAAYVYKPFGKIGTMETLPYLDEVARSVRDLLKSLFLADRANDVKALHECVLLLKHPASLFLPRTKILTKPLEDVTRDFESSYIHCIWGLAQAAIRPRMDNEYGLPELKGDGYKAFYQDLKEVFDPSRVPKLLRLYD
jgi:hypothetical protein